VKFNSRVCRGKAPANAGLGVISAGLPGFDLTLEDFGVRDALIEALPAEGAQLDLGDVEPRAMLGRVVDLQPVGQALGLGRLEEKLAGLWVLS
jgi:hypothetical protein